MSNQIILLVEDNPSDEALTLRAFRKSGILTEVVVVRDGVEALEYLSDPVAGAAGEPRPLPAVVLLDLKLPRLNGLEVLQRIRASPRTRLLPVIMLTSSLEERDVAASYAGGANSYVRKTVDFVQFTGAIRQLALYWLVLNVPAPPGRIP
jgi:two-component system response regulator